MLKAQERALRYNYLLARAAGKAYQRGALSGTLNASIQGTLDGAGWIIRHPPGNLAGDDCWELSQASAGVIDRWVYGGGAVGDIAEGIFGIPRGDADSAWNLDWSLRDVLSAVGLPVLNCTSYFQNLGDKYAQVNLWMRQAGIEGHRELADAVGHEMEDRDKYTKAPLKEKPKQSIMPWIIGAAALFVGYKVAVAAAPAIGAKTVERVDDRIKRWEDDLK